MPGRVLLGEILINEDLITKEQLQQALLEQKKSKKRLGRVLIDLGFISEEVMIDYLSNQITDILEECEINAPLVFSKHHDLMRKKILTQKKIPFGDEEQEREISRRLYAGKEKLGKAKELFKKGIYDEVVSQGYHALHHITRVVHDLQIHHHFNITRKLGIKSVYTGRSGTSQVERYSLLADKMTEEAHPSPKHYAKTVIKDTESYLKKVEKLFFQREKEQR